MKAILSGAARGEQSLLEVTGSLVMMKVYQGLMMEHQVWLRSLNIKVQ